MWRFSTIAPSLVTRSTPSYGDKSSVRGPTSARSGMPLAVGGYVTGVIAAASTGVAISLLHDADAARMQSIATQALRAGLLAACFMRLEYSHGGGGSRGNHLTPTDADGERVLCCTRFANLADEKPVFAHALVYAFRWTAPAFSVVVLLKPRFITCKYLKSKNNIH